MPEKLRPQDKKSSVSSNGARIGAYVCYCGGNISHVVDCERVAKHVAKLPNVVVGRTDMSMCSDAGQAMIEQDIKQLGLNRVVIVDVSLLGSEDSLATTGMLMRRILHNNIRHMTDIAGPTVRCLAVLEEDGKDINEVSLSDSCLFILGDHVGLPKKAEVFALRYGEKISLGKQPYLAASCITILNYLLDRKVKSYF